MVFYLVVDIKNGGTRSIEAREQFVHDNEQFHLGRLFDEEVLCPLLIVIGIVDAIASILERLLGPIVLEFSLRFRGGVS